jgi:peptidoglycan/LPS O-acetylase OafA/YrhL
MTQYGVSMMRLLRIVLLSVIALLMLCTVAVGLGTAATGLVEKGVLVAFGGLLLVAAVKVHNLGTNPSSS